MEYDATCVADLGVFRGGLCPSIYSTIIFPDKKNPHMV